MNSVNTNFGALVALQNLNATNRELAEVQNRINTGFKVSSARDNGAVFAIAEGQRTRVGALTAVSDGIKRATNTIDVGVAAGEAVNDLIRQMRDKAVQAQGAGLSTNDVAKLQTDFDALQAQINQVVNSAVFNGTNLVNGNSGATFEVLTTDDATTGATSAAELTGTAPASGVILSGNQELDGLDLDGTGAIAAGDLITFTVDTSGTTQAILEVEIQAGETIDDFLTRVGQETGGLITGDFDETTGLITWGSDYDFTAATTIASTGTEANTFLVGGGTSGAPVGGSGTGTVSVTIADFRDSTLGVTGLDLAADAAGAIAALDAALDTIRTSLATFGSEAKALEVQNVFLGKLSDTLKNSIGALVDADLAEESARLQSLQVKQQLGAQALSIANQSPQIILSFFQ